MEVKTFEGHKQDMREEFEGIDAVRYQKDGLEYEGIRKYWENKMQTDIKKAAALAQQVAEADAKAKAQRRAAQLKLESAIPDYATAQAQLLTATCVSIPQILRLAESAGFMSRGLTNHCLEAVLSVVNVVRRILLLTSIY